MRQDSSGSSQKNNRLVYFNVFDRLQNLTVALFFLLSASQLFSQQLPAVPPSRYNHFTKGVNLAFWFQCAQGGVPCSATNPAYLPITLSDVQTIVNVGLNYVRLPVDPRWLLPDAFGPAPPSVELTNLDNAIDSLIAANLGVDLVMMDPTIVPGSRGAHPGETIEIYGTGFGSTTPPSPAGILLNPAPLSSAATVTIGSRSITPEFSGIVGPGLYQFNVPIPADLAAGDYTLLIQIGGLQTQPNVIIPVQGN
jgi:hypothetical protein